MTTPCTQESMIKEIRDDIKSLLAFKNKLMGIQIAVSFIVTSAVAFVAWALSIVIK